MVKAKFKGQPRGLRLAAALVAGALLLAVSSALAQSGGIEAGNALTYAIPSQPLATALRKFAEASGLQIVYEPEIAAGKRSFPLAGSMTARAALTQILSGSGISFQFSSDGVVNLMGGVTAGVLHLGVVRVEGARGGDGGGVTAVNGVNGSSDVEATEGTGSYTSGALSIASKTAQSIKETPQSVSVITAQSIADQNLTDLNSILQAAPGVTVVANADSLNNSYYSRGFQVTTFQIDGGAPLALSGGEGSYISPLVDAAEFDSVQLLRGADGLFSGYGDPSGVINLVRKKPLDHDQVAVEAQLGSWDFHREVVDVTGPLAFDGKLRGRLVVSGQDEHFFYKIANDRRYAVYGVFEYDLTPSTLLTAGVDKSELVGLPFDNGLPRYDNGAPIPLSRSTCLCFAWNHVDYQTNEYFVELNQNINQDWLAKLNLTYETQRQKSLLGFVDGPVVPGFDSGPMFFTTLKRYPPKELSFDSTLTGSFSIFGHKQDVVLGGNYQAVDAKGFEFDYDSDTLSPLQSVNLFQFNPAAFPAPTGGPPEIYFAKAGQRQIAFYANIKLELLKNLHIITGFRYNSYHDTNQANYITITPSGDEVFNAPSSPTSGKNFSNPNVSIVYDIVKTLSAYVGYTTNYQPQFLSPGELNGQKEPAPSMGSNLEGGLKWERPDKKLNASLSVYSIEEDSFAAQIGNNFSYQLVSSSLYNIKSEGFDLEVSGEITPGWQISSSYSGNHNKIVVDIPSVREVLDQSYSSFLPRNLLKIWTTYRFQSATGLKGLSIGGGLDGQTTSYTRGFACTQHTPGVDPGTGAPTLVCTVASPFNFVVKPYATVNLRLGYQVNDRWTVSLNGTNVTDVKNFASSFASASGGNWYIQPAAFKFTLSAKW